MENFKDLNINELEYIDGGMSKADVKGLVASGLYVGGAVTFCFNPGIGLGLIGAGMATWDSMG